MEFLLGNPFSTPVGQCLGKAARRTGVRVGGGGGDRGLCGSLVPPRGRAGHPCHRALRTRRLGLLTKPAPFCQAAPGGPPWTWRSSARPYPSGPSPSWYLRGGAGGWGLLGEATACAPTGLAAGVRTRFPTPSPFAPVPPLQPQRPSPGHPPETVACSRLADETATQPAARGPGCGEGGRGSRRVVPGQGAAAGPRPRERREAVRSMVRALDAPCDLVQVTALSALTFALSGEVRGGEMEVLSNPNALIPRGRLCALTAAPCSGTLAGAAIFGCRVQRGARPACSAWRGRRRHGGGAPEGPPPW